MTQPAKTTTDLDRLRARLERERRARIPSEHTMPVAASIDGGPLVYAVATILTTETPDIISTAEPTTISGLATWQLTVEARIEAAGNLDVRFGDVDDQQYQGTAYVHSCQAGYNRPTVTILRGTDELTRRTSIAHS